MIYESSFLTTNTFGAKTRVIRAAKTKQRERERKPKSTNGSEILAFIFRKMSSVQSTLRFKTANRTKAAQHLTREKKSNKNH